VAVYGGLNLQLGTNPFTFPTDKKISPKLMVITQNQFGTRWVLVNNIIADKYGTDYPTLGLITTLTRGFNMRWSGFFELQAYKSDYYADNIFRVGAAYLIRENIQLDASISKNIKDTPSLLMGNIGISWRFDQNYERVLLRSSKPIKDKDKKGKKGKKKGNKRKDEVELEKTK
jgi:hypothetical protein